ncbi:arylamine N-acetyltransferase [Altererythrobacter atlanticus]|uniref:Arylamine N-acetyltransferase n=1 Tax=Croceibacterium atlanticum TaxID=1267766 RepID=A0A0F7KP32_9SPHN|nr:arylamine N-acetyltransferase [Croceibacterium atlanticum]AKH42278.1 Arylamine N-acetyltransferase [Croceibacterium atlanticum]MBB5731054.1 arylamine N-acetyltransferase [Croceibacterium atlanticum]
MELGDYLARIGLDHTIRPDLPSLQAMVGAQIAAVPFENLDVQRSLPLGTSPDAAWAKIVGQGRGGWCYEQNAVLGSALSLAGFAVRRIACGVLREEGTSAAMGGHLALIVQCEGRDWLVDAGFGSKLAGPLPLEEGAREDSPFRVSLGKTADGMWRFTEEGCGAAPFWFDFTAEEADEELLSAKCEWQRSNPASNFVGRMTMQIRDGDRHWAMRDRILTISAPEGQEIREIQHFEEWADLARNRFRVPLDPQPLWRIVMEREAAIPAPASPVP